MENNDNNMVCEFICGSILPREIYEKAKKKCEEADTTLYEFIKFAIYELASGHYKIIKKVVEDE